MVIGLDIDLGGTEDVVSGEGPGAEASITLDNILTGGGIVRIAIPEMLDATDSRVVATVSLITRNAAAEPVHIPVIEDIVVIIRFVIKCY